MAPGLEDRLKALEVDALIHTSGPFQGQDYRVARACAQAGVHYVDLADGRDFVCGIDVLDPQAKAAGVLLLSGASSVPALSSAVVDALASGMARVSDIDIGISPGNRTDRGLSTVAAILSYCGKPLPGLGQQALIGWLRSYGHDYPPLLGGGCCRPAISRILRCCRLAMQEIRPSDSVPGLSCRSCSAG
jgi:hypothetical protein